MKNYNFAFYITDKPRTRQWGECLARGAAVHGDRVELIHQEGFTGPLEGFDGGGKLGLNKACKTIMDAHLKAGKRFLFFDKGYTGRNLYWRVSVDAWQPTAYFQRFMHPDDRIKAAGVTTSIRPKRRDAQTIVFAGACQNYSNFCDLGNVNDYNAWVLRNLREHSDRKIIYRPNPSWYSKHGSEFRAIHSDVENVELSEPSVPFMEELRRCHLLVTHGSSASVTAFAHGIPVMILGGGVCKPVGLGVEWDQIEQPFWPKESVRQQFFADLAYCQWTVEEYRNGAAWAELRSVFAALDQDKGEELTLDGVIRQYRIMHRHPGYFRGLTTLKYSDVIMRLVHKYKVKEILDYGCGKGEQYHAPHNLAKMWGVRVGLYDPGVPEFSSLPDGSFGGVICCDVMEHIPEAYVDSVLREIFDRATRFVFFAIATDAATKQLPDGQNCHLTIRPKEWWSDKIRAVWKMIPAEKRKLLDVTVLTPEDLKNA